MRSLPYRALLPLALASAFLFPVLASADTIGISPSSGTYLVGKVFPVSVYVTSTAESVNAVSGTVTFPADKLQVVSVSKVGSILTLWTSEPTYSNNQGTVTFEGVVPNPGFQGSSGRVVTINFQVIAQGVAPVKFSSASILANDGNGTDILKNLNSASFTLGNAPETPVGVTPTAPIESSVPFESGTSKLPAPVVSSTEFPDQKKWYSINNGTFSWEVPSDVTDARILVSKQANSVPTKVYTPAISSKEVTDVQDGVWYFHVQLKNQNGWGGITHYIFKVDTVEPDTFTIKGLSSSDPTNPEPQFTFKATDETSGINHYQVQIDSKDPKDWNDDGTGLYKTPVLGPGVHTLVAKAFDWAGNFSTASINFSITGIEPPIITSYTEQISGNTPLIVQGKAPKGDSVRLMLTRIDADTISMNVKVDETGLFVEAFDGNKLKGGVYKLTAVSVDSRGAESLPTVEKTVLVNAGWFDSLGAQIANILSVIVPILALLFMLTFVIIYGLHKIRVLKRKISGELHDVERMVDKAFALLKEDVEDSIHLLERTKSRRKLTEEEAVIVERFRQNLQDAEKVIHKQMKDIENEIGV